ncbi:mechanosensitive ion channel [Robiginitalea sp. M366]|uniref:mechanosensitive ion channel family protein n=1 Tax=Robiginitalea aestuariiviva TaxID=3036903 RepID=UPI00240CF286|nr:mechanosensitive ion channel domain-containing protein [Robiginitalea aestuariiviva]MDG1570774.1 mechanosensitive ion channel [Robiginitalea aestuariiviva]
METIDHWKEITLSSLKNIGQEVSSALPSLAGALLMLVLGAFAIRIVLWATRRLLRVSGIDRLSEKLNEADLFGNPEMKLDLGKILLGFLKWLLYLVLVIILADILNWTIVSTEIGNLLRYLPRLFSAIALMLIGLYIASYIRKAIRSLFESLELSGSKIISNLVFYAIVLIVSVTALNQAGIDTTIITGNVTLILGALLLAGAIGFGLGSREIFTDLLRGFYSRKTYMAGDRIAIRDKGIEGTIETIDSITVVIKTEKGKVVFPIRELVENRVEIL